MQPFTTETTTETTSETRQSSALLMPPTLVRPAGPAPTQTVAERVLPHLPNAGGPQLSGAAKNEKKFNNKKNLQKKR